ncbi:MAG: sigma 54-interacting transcriptional regulator [Gemmatimonadetes bacterium]|nr:sigma 54-interacting transcriptional regulator [Gemmatimonadota bacterium]
MQAGTSLRFRETVERAHAERAAGDYRAAIHEYTNALVSRGDDLSPEEEADLRVRIAECFLEFGDTESATTAIAPAEELEDSLTAVGRGSIRTLRARLELYAGRVRAAEAAANDAFESLRGTGENLLVARALTCRAHAARQLGRLDDARDDYADAMAAARRADDEHEVGLAASHLGSLLWLSGRYVEAREWHRRAVRHHEASGSESRVARDLFALGIDETWAGDWAQADATFARGLERAERNGDAWLAAVTGIAQARLALWRGEDPRGALEDVRVRVEADGSDHDLVVIGQLLGEAAIARGDWTEAVRVLRAAHERARRSAPEGEATLDTAWRLALAEEALPGGTSRLADELATIVAAAASRGYAITEIMARREYGLALLEQGRVDEARRHVEQSLEHARMLGLPYEVARGQLSLGRLVVETAEPIKAAPVLRDAIEGFRALGASRETSAATELLAASTGESPAELATGDPFAVIATGADVLKDAIERARRIAPSNIPVLVTGETGTGKELFARAIHRASSRADHPFLAVNCAALSETLLESELFGHERGSFTGAERRKIGIFEAAEGGTVFLDEIGKAPVSLQAKLLRVLDTGEVRRVGGLEAIHVNVRIVAATNRDLDELVRHEGFLPDLLYRLRGFEIRVAPLRERTGDVALLFERFARRPASNAAREVLDRYDWPGNVREIRNLAESAAFLTPGRGPIPVDALPDRVREPQRAALGRAKLADTEKAAVLRALAQAGGNRSRAARALGISRQTLYTKISKFGIARDAA